MKTLFSLLVLLLASSNAFAVLAAPPLPGTNDPLTSIAVRINAMDMNNAYTRGKMDTLQHQVDQVQRQFLYLVLGVGIVLTAFCLLSIRDQVKRNRRLHRPTDPRDLV